MTARETAVTWVPVGGTSRRVHGAGGLRTAVPSTGPYIPPMLSASTRAPGFSGAQKTPATSFLRATNASSARTTEIEV